MANNDDESNESTNSSESMSPEKLLIAVEEAKSKAEENWNLYLRTRADIENVRRRAQVDVENAYKYSVEKFARELLAVVDSLEHGLAIPVPNDAKALHEGMELTLKLLLDTLEKFGIKRLEPEKGETFNPTCHEALTMQITSEVEPNKILFVAQKGFTLHERILRPARVIVAKAPIENASATEETAANQE